MGCVCVFMSPIVLHWKKRLPRGTVGQLPTECVQLHSVHNVGTYDSNASHLCSQQPPVARYELAFVYRGKSREVGPEESPNATGTLVSWEADVFGDIIHLLLSRYCKTSLGK